jgi:hypothetical protein
VTKAFRAWAAGRKAARHAMLRRLGFDYAAGVLLTVGNAAIPGLELEADDMFPNPFDQGIMDAIQACMIAEAERFSGQATRLVSAIGQLGGESS